MNKYHNKQYYIDNIKNKIKEDKSIIEYLTTGFEDLDKKISGYQNEELIIIGSKPNGGKTYLALGTVLNAIENRKKVQYFLMGEKPERIISKLVCLKFNLSIKNFELGNYSSINKEEIFKFIDLISEYLTIDYDLFLDIYYIEQELNMLSCSDPKDLIVIDSLNYIVNEMDEKVDLIKKIKSFSHSFQIPVILLATIDIESDLKHTINPYKSFYPYTQSIFEYSNKVLALYSDETIRERKEFLKEIESKEKCQNPLYKSTFVNFPIIKKELFILKNTSGFVSNHKLDFSKKSGKFSEMSIPNMDIDIPTIK